MLVTGTITAIKPYNTTAGERYNIEVDGESYGYGKYAPKARVGDSVEFTYTANGKYKNIDFKSFKAVAGGAGKAAAVASAAVATTGGSAKGNSYDDRQDVISRQAALNSALNFITIAQSAGAIAVNKTAKPAEIYSLLEQLVLEKMAEFYTINTGQEYKDIGVAKAKSKLGGAAAAVAAAEDDDE